MSTPVVSPGMNTLNSIENVMRFIFSMWNSCLTACMTCERVAEENFEEAILHQKCVQRRKDAACKCSLKHAAPETPVIVDIKAPRQHRHVCEIHGAY